MGFRVHERSDQGARSARVAEWTQSGKTANELAADKPYKGSTLGWRAWQLRRGKRDGVNATGKRDG